MNVLLFASYLVIPAFWCCYPFYCSCVPSELYPKSENKPRK